MGKIKRVGCLLCVFLFVSLFTCVSVYVWKCPHACLLVCSAPSCLCAWLYVCLFTHLSVCVRPSVSLFINFDHCLCLWTPICVSVHLFISMLLYFDRPSFCMSVSQPVSLSVRPSVSVSIFASSVCLYVCPPVCPSVGQCGTLSSSICLYACLSHHLSVWMSVHPSVCLSYRPSVNPFTFFRSRLTKDHIKYSQFLMKTRRTIKKNIAH